MPRDDGKVATHWRHSAMQHDKLNKLPQLIEAVPGVEARDVVRADEIIHLLLRIAAPQLDD